MKNKTSFTRTSSSDSLITQFKDHNVTNISSSENPLKIRLFVNATSKKKCTKFTLVTAINRQSHARKRFSKSKYIKDRLGIPRKKFRLVAGDRNRWRS